MTMQMMHEAFGRGRADVVEASQALEETRRTIDRRVSGFLGSGWTGAAAEAFADAWEQWLAGAADVKEGLDAMSALLEATQRDWAHQDEASQQRLDVVSAKIVDRLG
ncbi:WXG100 family type VII secretion target [Nocardioides rubriscoriae]|uniref:WXG100 family type VII secretion target n=1 Tax=Nocardioides rubriscoriae TaxID=642762 RepID=UPI0011DF91C1|nr:WXG100 family type VII secretion target [Nocardioides rubriscoriae]